MTGAGRRWRRAALVALAAWACASAGCREPGQGEEERGEPPGEAAGGAEEGGKPAGGAAARRGAADRDMPALGPERVGPLDGRSRAGREELAKLFPGAEVARGPGRSLLVARGGETLLSVQPADDGAVSSVRVVSRRVPSELGVRVGDSYEALARAAGPLACNGGLEERAREVLCTPRRTSNVTFHFRLDDDALAGDDLEPTRQAKLLAGRRVREIHWTPPAR